MTGRPQRALTVLIAGVLVASCTAPTTVDTVLDSAEQALGGPAALVKLEAVRITGHGTWAAPALGFPGMPYRSEVVYQLPDKLYWEVQPEMGEPMMMGYDGAEAWGVWGAPPARHRGRMEAMVMQTVAEMQLAFVTPARSRQGSSFALVSPDPTGDPPTYNLTYRTASGAEWNVWYDAETGHQVRLEHAYPYMMSDKLVDGVVQRSRPESFGPLTFPAATKLVGTMDGETYEVVHETVDDIEINPDLLPDQFSMPERDLDPDEIGVKTIPPMTVVTREHRGPVSEIGDSITRLMNGLLDAGLMSMGPVHCTYFGVPDPKTGELEAELAAPVTVTGEAPELPEGLALESWDEMEVAYAYHLGDHAGEGQAHQRLSSWMRREDHTAAGPPRALWFHDPAVTVTEDLVTEVQVPVD